MGRLHKDIVKGLIIAVLAISCSDGETGFEMNDIPERPQPRGGAPAVWVPGEQSMLFFGGMSPITSDTWKFSVTENNWNEITDSETVPDARCHHTLVSDANGTDILMFGGFNISGRFNDTWRFNTDNGQWTELDVQGRLPDRRCLQSSAYIESTGQMFVYGGISGGGALSGDFFEDTWLFNTQNAEWEEITTENSPGKLSGAVAFYSSVENSVFLWGGKQVNSYPVQLWEFDVDNLTWSTVETGGTAPVGREDPTYFWNDETQTLYLTHGANENVTGVHPEDSFELDLNTLTWTEIENQEIPPVRWRSSVVFDPESQTGYMFGGWLGFNQENMNDTWQYDFENREWTQLD